MMNQKRKTDAYEKLFVHFSKKVERCLVTAAISLAVLLILSQCLLQINVIRHMLTTVDALEGSPYGNASEDAAADALP